MSQQIQLCARRKDERKDEHLIGVPNRDLSVEEYAALSDAQRTDVARCGLYELVDPAPSTAAAPSAADAAPPAGARPGPAGRAKGADAA